MMMYPNLSSTIRSPMASFGANLRREREMRGVPLEEISEATKISVRCLQALEAEQFSKLPGGIFTRSFIRAYAKYLGLDEDKVMAEFQVLAPPMEEADLSRLATPMTKEPRAKSRALLVALLLGVALLAGGYTFYSSFLRRAVGPAVKGASSGPVTSAPAQVSAPTQSSPGGAPSVTEKTTTPAGTEPGTAMAASTPGDLSKSTPASSAPATGASASPTDSGLTLQVAATEQSWIAVDVDGKTVMQGILKPNEIQSFKAKGFFDLRTGNAQGIILTLNGETLKPLGRHGEFKKVHLTQNDVKSPTP